MSSPKVSIIIPFKDRFDLVTESCQSIFAQSFGDYEIILIDDGSKTKFEVSEILLHPKVKYFFHENRGPSASRNRGIQEAQGEYIAFLDSDDLFHPDKLKIQITAMENQHAVISHTSYLRFHDSGEAEEVIDTSRIQGHAFPRIILSCPIATPCIVVKKNIIIHYPFDEDLRAGEDTVVWTRIAEKYPFLYLNNPLTLVRIHGSNAAFSYGKHLENTRNVLNKLKQHGVKVPLLYKYLRLTKSIIITTGSKIIGFMRACQPRYFFAKRNDSHNEHRIE